MFALRKLLVIVGLAAVSSLSMTSVTAIEKAESANANEPIFSWRAGDGAGVAGDDFYFNDGKLTSNVIKESTINNITFTNADTPNKESRTCTIAIDQDATVNLYVFGLKTEEIKIGKDKVSTTDVGAQMFTGKLTVKNNEIEIIDSNDIGWMGIDVFYESVDGEVATKSYNVTFDSNEGSNVDVQTIEKDKKAVKPNDPIKEGYIFDGWYTDKLFNQEYDFSNPVTKNITLYAKWLENKEVLEYVTVTYVVEEKEYEVVEVVKGQLASKPSDPIKMGYNFEGWYTDKFLSNKFDIDNKVVNYNMTLYANFVSNDKEDNMVKIMFIENTNGELLYEMNVVKGSTLTVEEIPVPEKEGYIFFNWYLNGGGTKLSSNYVFEADTYAYTSWQDYTEGQVHVRLMDFGSCYEIYRYNPGTVIGWYPVPYVPGYDFNGWFNGTEQFTIGTVINEDKTYYASRELDMDIIHQKSTDGEAYRVIATLREIDMSLVSEIKMTFTATNKVDNTKLTGSVNLYKVYDSITDLDGYKTRDDKVYYAVYILEGINEDEFLNCEFSTEVSIIYDYNYLSLATVTAII